MARKKADSDDRRASNKARRLFVDELTGAPVGTTAQPGTVEAELWVAKVRPRTGSKLEQVAIAEDELGRIYEVAGVKLTRREMKARARAVAKDWAERMKRVRKVQKRKGKQAIPGVLTTFRTAGKAADEFIAENEEFVLAATESNLDIADALDEWMARRSVWTSTSAEGAKGYFRSLDQTKKGQQIRGKRREADRIKAAVQWVFSQAKTKRYGDVSWAAINELGDMLLAEFVKQDVAPPPGITATGWTWYPTASGELDASEILERVGPDEARAVLAYYNSQALERELDHLADAFKRARKCLTKDQRAVVSRRIRSLQEVLEDPETLAEQDICGADPNVPGLCSFAAVDREIRRLRRTACALGVDSFEDPQPYSASAPSKLAEEYLAGSQEEYQELATFPPATVRAAERAAALAEPEALEDLEEEIPF